MNPVSSDFTGSGGVFMVVRKADSSDQSGSRKSDSDTVSAQDRLVIEQVFSSPGEHPFDAVDWQKRLARICDANDKTIFEQDDVEVPADWSQLAINVVASKYFYGELGTDQRETSVKQLVHRVTRTIADWGKQDGVFATDEEGERFYQELTYLCVNQYGAFNSPVWFNVGLFHHHNVPGSSGNFHWDPAANAPRHTAHCYEYPQSSACFIQSVDDTMEDIMRLAQAEAMLFKYGSGSGTDLSTLRSSREKLSGGGTPSGPLSFMRIFDQIAAVVRSGGKTRRAAKMQSLRCDHPDIREFIECKMNEEKKAWSLIEQGYDGSFNGEAYASVMFQNANLSVRVTDEFMQAAVDDADWQTFAVTTGEPLVKHKARELLKLIAEGTHVCGDPGVQYHTTINNWHTCANSGEICASNPCSEYMFLNDSACNLASLNLMKFRREDGRFEIKRFQAAVRLFIIAQDILVDHSSYPLETICRNSHEYRPLGLGYANLGAMIMSLGLPYDSDAGRATAAAITALLTGTAYRTSAELASRLGPFTRFHENHKPMTKVINMHRSALENIERDHCDADLCAAAEACWKDAFDAGQRFGYRNAQVTVLAPTGTIGFLMDCDTTGVEPDIALVKYKQLAGGGMFKMVNRTVPQALERLGYNQEAISGILEHIDSTDTIEGAPYLQDKHLAVFDCAFKPATGTRSINYMGHIKMMGAVQPFLSGAISKTVNMPKEATVEEIMDVYIKAWRLGLKAVAIYRDGSKRTQPVNVDKKSTAKAKTPERVISLEELDKARRTPHRQRLQPTLMSKRHKFDIAGHEGYLHVGLYEDGKPGELFITMAKEGSTVGGMMDAFATAISLCLQYGVPLEALVKKFAHQRFEPSGLTATREIPFAKSIVDYVFRWMGLEFLGEDYRMRNLPQSQCKKTQTPPNKPTGPATVTDDASARLGSARQAPDTDVQEPPGASAQGLYVANQGSNSDSANNVGAAPGVTQRLAANRLMRLDDQFRHYQEDAPVCDECGSITVRNGNCYKCYTCGASLGCS
ncbi:MAG: vitamin B12-dependent ribonucleotide reductase [Planctomycetes bacterium]|nr:vitamin B12-dependent ribonucleotide reductase [Planctomycetota bacterium]